MGFSTHLSSRNKQARAINFHIQYLTPAKILEFFLFVYLFVFIVCCGCLFVSFLVGREVTGSKLVPSIKNIVREIYISSCEGKYPDRDNAKLFFLKSQRGRLRVQWKQYKLSECNRIFPGTCKPTYKS